MIQKVITGFVIQEFTNEGTAIRQEFVAGDPLDAGYDSGIERDGVMIPYQDLKNIYNIELDFFRCRMVQPGEI